MKSQTISSCVLLDSIANPFMTMTVGNDRKKIAMKKIPEMTLTVFQLLCKRQRGKKRLKPAPKK